MNKFILYIYAILCQEPESGLNKSTMKRTQCLRMAGMLFAAVLLASGCTDQNDCLRRRIGNTANKINATVGVAVIINGKDTLTCNNSQKYPLMSVFKFHQALAVADRLHQEGASLDSVLHIRRQEVKEGTYSPLRDEHPDRDLRLSIGELLRYTLQLSDNNACDILFDRVADVGQTERYIRGLGIGEFDIVCNEEQMAQKEENCYRNWSSPLSAAMLLEKFLTGACVEGTDYQFIKQLMLECPTGKERLPRPFVEKEVILGHKTGTGGRNSDGRLIAVNDLGFVQLADGTRYTIAVFIKDAEASLSACEEVIAEISQAVFEHISLHYQNPEE